MKKHPIKSALFALLLGISCLSYNFCLAEPVRVVIHGSRVNVGQVNSNGECEDHYKCIDSDEICFVIEGCPPCPGGPVYAGANGASYTKLDGVTVTPAGGSTTMTATSGDGTVVLSPYAIDFSVDANDLNIVFYYTTK